MRAFRVVSFILVFVLVMAAAVMSALAAGSSANVSLMPGVLKISDIRIDSFELILNDNGTRTYTAHVGGFTVTDGRGSGKGWNVRIWAYDHSGGQMVIAGTKGGTAPHSDEFKASCIDSEHDITAYPSSFISVPAGQGKGTYYFTGSEITLTLVPGEDASMIASITVAVEIVSNTF